MPVDEETKQQIIEVADKRFRRYGFGKTTMAEIAGDCRMSAANLYRFFKSKGEIGEEICLRCMHAKEAMGREVLHQTGLSAADRLQAFVIAILRYTHELSYDHLHLSELVAFISQERQEIVDRHLNALRSIVAEILAEGNRDGLFDVADIVKSADMVLTAIIYFDYPPLVMMGKRPLSELEECAKAVVELIVNGLKKR